MQSECFTLGSKNMQRSLPCLVFFFFSSCVNSVGVGARSTEPARENKLPEAQIRNIRGKKVIAVVNELYRWLWVGCTSLLRCSDRKKDCVHILE